MPTILVWPLSKSVYYPGLSTILATILVELNSLFTPSLFTTLSTQICVILTILSCASLSMQEFCYTDYAVMNCTVCTDLSHVD